MSVPPPLPPLEYQADAGVCRSATTNTTTTGGIADKVSNAASYISESVQGAVSGVSKEGNKVSPSRLVS